MSVSVYLSFEIIILPIRDPRSLGHSCPPLVLLLILYACLIVFSKLKWNVERLHVLAAVIVQSEGGGKAEPVWFKEWNEFSKLTLTCINTPQHVHAHARTHRHSTQKQEYILKPFKEAP